MKRDLEIICLYRSNQGREVNYYSLKMGYDLLDSNDYIVDNFWQTMGGLTITVDGYKNILRSTNFYNVVKVINFLIHSLYYLNQEKSDWFDFDEDYSNQVTVKTMDSKILKLKALNSKEISLSYVSLIDNIDIKRGEYTFVNEIIEIEVWKREAKLALEEYFSILKELILKEKEDNTTIRIMKDYLNVYNKIAIINDKKD